MGGREHGTYVKYVVEKCHCELCRAANRDYERKRTRQQAYGHHPYVDAQPAREHVRALMSAGVGLKRIAKLSGVPHGSVAKLIYGEAHRNLAPSKRIRPATSKKLLAVQLPSDPTAGQLAAGARVDATGTRRRLQALVAIGYSQSRLAQRLGLLPTNFPTLLARDGVTARTAREVVALYDELWNTPQYGTDHRSRISANRARRMAAKRGWPPPMAWDDDTIDAPDAEPAAEYDEQHDPVLVERVLAGDRFDRGQLTDADKLEVARRLVDRGQASRVGSVLRISWTTAKKLVSRLDQRPAEEVRSA